VSHVVEGDQSCREALKENEMSEPTKVNITTEEYDALPVKDPNTLYLIRNPDDPPFILSMVGYDSPTDDDDWGDDDWD
jgi:hypothetical protein